MALNHIERAVDAMNLSPANRKKLVKAMYKDFEELKALDIQDASIICQQIIYYTFIKMGCNDQFIERFSRMWEQVNDDIGDQVLSFSELKEVLHERGIDLADPY